ncbi:uncharacterized protein LOC120627377 [Pararge aegeria]|uniref:uncharacterized protein LOC120627377 n=1 Tax=Pararge aegeria TaxID=116150 RepID=UPI0019CF9AEC|nr:uncharacterized protein LOC120627377 [Pararge aegeria]
MVTIVLRQSKSRIKIENQGYFISSGSYTDFKKNFPDLVNEIFWNPNARFIIVVSDLTKMNLGKVFDLLLEYHVSNVLVMDGSEDPVLYTYNPFENYGCGQRYDRIIEYGKCSKSQENLYPPKLVTGLRNCTFKAILPHWPPYSINPAKSDGSKLPGIEEALLSEIGKLEHFQINFTYSDDGEEFSMIENGVNAVGPLYFLQKRKADMMLGGMILTHQRAKAFHYICEHLAYTDEIAYQVKTATAVASWKNTYLEFDGTVWTVFIFAFLVYFLIFIILVRPRDKGRIMLKMVGYLFLAGNIIRGNFFTRYLFIHWVLFAYIINVYYVSNLVSLTTNPLSNYQVSEEEDLAKFNMQPCVSPVIKGYLSSVKINDSIWKHQRDGCDNLLESINTVRQSDDLYTVVIRSLYKYNKFNFCDEWGDHEIYTFHKPLTKTIYAIYLYKGFPMLEQLNMQTLRMRENGLIERFLYLLYHERRDKYHFKTKKERYHVNVPWYILLFGYILSAVVFIMELIIKKFKNNKSFRLDIVPAIK